MNVRRILLLLIIFVMIFADNSFAFIRDKGVLSVAKSDFYFTGYSLYFWSNRKSEFKDKYNVIHNYDFDKKIRKTFLKDDCFFIDLTISLNGNYLGVICTSKKKPNSLIVLNLKGEKIIELSESVQEYTWHPDGNKIIYMTGDKTYRGDERVIIPSGVWLYDINKKTKTKIAEKGWNIRKESFDKHIYFWNGEDTVRYNIDSKKLEVTNIKENMNYSPNGRYYVYGLSAEDPDNWKEPYWSPFRIFDTKENKDLPPEKIGFISERNPGNIVWGRDSKKIAFNGRLKRTIYEQAVYIYDLEANHVLKQFKGEIVGFSNDRTVIVIYRDGEFFIENL